MYKSPILLAFVVCSFLSAEEAVEMIEEGILKEEVVPEDAQRVKQQVEQWRATEERSRRGIDEYRRDLERQERLRTEEDRRHRMEEERRQKQRREQEERLRRQQERETRTRSINPIEKRFQKARPGI